MLFLHCTKYLYFSIINCFDRPELQRPTEARKYFLIMYDVPSLITE